MRGAFGLVWLLSVLAWQTEAQQRYFIIAPNVFRLNVEETVSVQVWQTTKIRLFLQDEKKLKIISPVETTFQPNKPGTKPALAKLKITDKDMPKFWENRKVYFYLVAKGPGFQKETQILVDTRGGTVFIQTDKPIYSPKEMVKYRVIPVGLDLRPLKQKVMVEITNPNGIRVYRKRDVEAWKEGFETSDFALGNIPVHGTWKITVHFGIKNLMNSSTTFVVKEYVLPTFAVRISAPNYISSTDKEIPVTISAKYSYGKDLTGGLRVGLSLVGKGEEVGISNESFPIRGERLIYIKKDKLLEPKAITSFPSGRNLKISAVVTEGATGTMQAATDSSTVLVDTPYTISFENTVKYFKPAVSFRVKVNVIYPNKEPAKDVKLRFSAKDAARPLLMDSGSSNLAKTNEKGEAFFTLNMPNEVKDNTKVDVTVKTEMNSVKNTESKLSLKPYKSANGNYILVRPPVTLPKIGQIEPIKVLIPAKQGARINQLSYLVVSRGRIVDQGVVLKTVGTETSFRLKITAEMAPSCRILVYYENAGEVAVDSVLMDVEDGYQNKVSIEARASEKIAPAKNVEFTVTSQKNSVIGLLGVDQSVYFLRNKSRVTNKKVFEEINGFDLGCGVGAGKDNRDVFHNAGLSAITNTAFTTAKRNQLGCLSAGNSRKRRSIKSTVAKVLKKCCKGECCVKISAPLIPKQKSYQICGSLKGKIKSSCWEDFYRCCTRNLVFGRSAVDDGEWVAGPDDLDSDETQVTVRQFFPETWIWEQRKTGNADKTTFEYTVPDSITTWEVMALSINDKDGLGLSNTLALESSKNVFIHIKMPYSVQRMEQITVYAVVYSYNERRTRVNIFMKGHESICSNAKPGEKSERRTAIIPPRSALAFPFTVIPLKSGKIPIEFIAFTMDTADRIIKDLLVVPEGVQKQITKSILLDPQGRVEDKKKKSQPAAAKKSDKQVNVVDLAIPEDHVKDSQLVMVYVTGNLMGAAVEDMINGGLTKLIQLPTGCGEQTMIRLGPVVYVLKYLYSIENGVTPTVEKKAYDFMRKGYNHELKWRRDDNSYSVWGQRTAASTWLTAFVNKVFCQAKVYINDDIDENIVCQSLRFLESIQAADGSFPEGYAVRHREMIGGVSSKLSLTAFVVISIMECKTTCPQHDSNVVLQATTFLETKIAAIKSGYLMSLVAYALSKAGSARKRTAYNKLVGMLKSELVEGREVMYIKDGGAALTVEATAYTLLTMMELKETDSAGPLVIWLTQQRNAKGSFHSTQDTVVALQALSEYSSKTAGGELDLSITMTSSREAEIRKTIRVTHENALVRQQYEITGALPGKVYIDTKGKGTAQLQVVTTYNKPTSLDEQCGYIIEVETVEDKDNTVSDAGAGVQEVKKKKKKSRKCKKNKKKKNKKKKKKCRKTKESQNDDQTPNVIKVEVCARHKFSNGSSMTIMDIGLVTGFKADEKALKKLLSLNQNPRIDRYEINNRSVIIYLGKISHEKKTCVTVKMNRHFTVGDIHAVPIKVYDYYEPADACSKFYGPKKNSQLLRTICGNDDECQCSQGGCADKPSTNPKSLKKKACLATDFVFVGTVKEVKDLNTEERIALIVKTVYKTGKKDHIPKGKLHVYKSKSCAYPNFKKDQDYIIMVKDGLKYVIDKGAFVLSWPNERKKITKLRMALDEVEQGNVCDNLSY